MRSVFLVALCALIIVVQSAWANWVQDGVALCTATGDQRYLQLTSDGAGGAIVTWQDNRSGTNWGIYAQRVNASGAVQWTIDGVVLCTAAATQYNPSIISDGAGGAIVTWEDIRSGNFDIYAQRVNASGALQWTAEGVALCMASWDQFNAKITCDGEGGAFVTWVDDRSGHWDIYAQRVSASGTAQWAADGVAVCTAAGDQWGATIISDGEGGAIVTWQDKRGGNHWDVYAQRVNASGSVQWLTDGVALGSAPGDQEYPMAVSDGTGGAVVTWMDNPSGASYDIYAQRVNASGAAEWTTNGVALCAAGQDQYAPTITLDGAGGAIVTWIDNRSGDQSSPMLDIYAQRVDVSGTVQWTTDGVAVCTATRNQAYPTITSDGVGGAIVTWYEYRSRDYDIYAQRVNALGAVRWMPNGVVLCAATGAQQEPRIASDGAGGAIVAWHDQRGGSNGDIYALKVDANGFAPLAATDVQTVPIELHQNYPNPFNPTTTVTYSIADRYKVTLKIFDLSGRCVACLVDRQQEKGSYAVEWKGKDERGNTVASGIYLCRLAVGSQAIVRKMVLLR